MAFADDAVRVLRKPPYEDAPAAPEAARNEASAIAKRALNTYNQDPRGQGPSLALPEYLEALDLDPSCKAAYEGIAKLVLGKASDSQPAVTAALGYVDVAVKRIPQDNDLKELQKKLRGLLPQGPAEPALAKAPKVAGVKAASSARVQTAKPPQRCKYCNSPIPAGADSCRSCEMSGEIQRPGGPVPEPKSPLPIIALVGVLLLVIGGVAAALLLRK